MATIPLSRTTLQPDSILLSFTRVAVGDVLTVTNDGKTLLAFQGAAQHGAYHGTSAFRIPATSGAAAGYNDVVDFSVTEAEYRVAGPFPTRRFGTTMTVLCDASGATASDRCGVAALKAG